MMQAWISWIVGDWLPLRYMGDALHKKPRLQALDGLRAYAAVSVIVFHAILLFDPELVHLSLPKLLWSLSASDIWPKIWLATFNGAAAVELFFLISGCVLIRSLNAALASESSFLRIGTAFAVRRALRIYPALMVCVLVATAVQSEVFSWTDAAANMTLWDADVIEPSWTLQVEMLALPLILLIAILSQRW